VSGGDLIKQQVSQNSYQRLKVGDTVDVKVSPHNQNLCRAEMA